MLSEYEFNLASLELIPGGGGAFEVTLNDTVIFSKHQEGRFPEHDEVLRHLD